MVISTQELVSEVSDLVSLPEVYQRVNTVIENPQSTADSVGKVISQDPALTARLLKIANSPFYGFASEIETVSKAVAVLGTKKIRDLVLASSLSSVFDGISSDLVSMQAFWKHSVFCGLIARNIAFETRKAQGEFVFIAGLLHDIGKLVICSKLPDLAREASLMVAEGAGNIALNDAEQKIMGFDHAQVGGELVQHWKLPVSLQECVEYHHDPGKAKDNPVEVAIVSMANIITNFAEQETGADFDPAKIDPLAWQVTGLESELIEPLISGAQAQISEVQSLLSMA
jgi:putative nucleotidyltransferase with HDIG domain